MAIVTDIGKPTHVEAAPARAISAEAMGLLRHLFLYGPMRTGTLLAEGGHQELERARLVVRNGGWQWLTSSGMATCFLLGVDKEKDEMQAKQQQYRERTAELARLLILGSNA